MLMFRPNISTKLLVLLLVVSLVPMGLLSVYWYHTTQVSLRSDAEARQKLQTQSDAYRVDQYMTDKVNALIIHSQATSVQTFHIGAATTDLESLIQQDGDIQQLSLTDQKGNVVINLDRSGALPSGANVASGDAFRAATYLAGKEYISPVTFNSKKQPMVTIAAPLIQYTSGQDLANLSTAGDSQIRTSDQISGVLIERVSLNNLWQSVFSKTANSDGYAYVVDSEGALIGYPDTAFKEAHQNLKQTAPVAAFLANPSASPKPVTMTSERGLRVLSSYAEVSRTNWGVIGEVPLSTVFATANHAAAIGMGILAIAAVVIVIASYIASQRVASPIKRLAAGAEQISLGKLDTRIIVKSRDEIGLLAQAFNRMAARLAAILQQAVAESTKANVILNNVSEGILALDAQGNIMLANVAAAVFIGELPQNIIHKPMKDLYHWTVNGKPFSPLQTGVGIYQEIMLTNANKRVYFVDMLVNPIRDDPMGINCILTILDKSKEREFENMKVDFVSMAAHELRTPMTSIRGYVDLIQHEQGFTPSDTIKDYINHIEASSVQLVGLINNLLNVSRIERGALTLRRDKVDWAELVQKSIADQQFTAKAKSLTLTYEGPPSGVYLFADPLAITEVINNLVSNAINHTLTGGTVAVTIVEVGDEVVTKVIDNGVGISEQALPHLFTKFFRARSSLTSGSGGTGLGLFISRSIVEMHDGRITAESEEGRGSTFTVVLPTFDEETYNREAKVKSESITRSHGWIIKNTSRRR